MRQTAVLAVILLAGSPAFAVDSQLLSFAMPDAKVMAGINVTNARNSTFGQYILSRIPAGDQGLQMLISTTGFDPRRDLYEILMASNGQPGSKAGLVMARGNFNVAAITAAAGQQTQTYAGATLMTSAGAKNAGAVAFLNGGAIAIAGDAASVKAALDRQNNPAAIDSGLAAQVDSLSKANDAWSVSIASLGSLLPAEAAANASANQITNIVKNIQSSSGGVKLSDAGVAITAQATADTADNAGALADVIRLLVTLAGTNANANPQAAVVLSLLQSLQITTSGAAVNLSLMVPEAQVEGLLNTAAAIAPGNAVGNAALAHRHRAQ